MSEAHFERIRPGLTGECRLIVERTNTAAHLGSGGVEVLATPEMVRLMERAAVAAGDPLLPAGYVTVGIHLDVSHLAPTPVGVEVVAQAELVAVEGRKLTFRVEARDAYELVGRGTHQRMIVDLQRFRDRLRTKGPQRDNVDR